MKISKMSNEELEENLIWMSSISKNDPYMSNFNFDPETWRDKFIELIEEKYKRELNKE